MRASSAVVLVLALLGAAAQAAPEVTFTRPINKDCIRADSPTTTDVSLFPDRYLLVGDEYSTEPLYTEVTSALGFSVQYFNNYKVVNNTIAGELYVLYQCVTAQPSRDDFPPGTKFFQIPLTSVSSPETVPFAFMEALGVPDRVYDVPSYVVAPCGQRLRECGREAVDFMAAGNATLLAEAVGASVDGVAVTSPGNPYFEAFTFSAAQDPGVLHRAEWIKFMGLFFNRERAASDAFAAIKASYEETKAVAAAAVAADGQRPTVAWVNHYVYETEESYQLSFAEYKGELTQDAGGAMLDFAEIAATKGVRPVAYDPTILEFAWAGEGAKFGSKAEAQAAFMEALKKADVLIDETYALDPTQYGVEAFKKEFGLTDAQAAGARWLPAGAAPRVYRNDGRLSAADMGSDWFEGAMVRPGEVLQDMARAVHPQMAGGASGFTWVRSLEEHPVLVGADQCTALTGCAVTPAAICPFVSLCPGGGSALLKGSSGQACAYEACTGSAAPATEGAAPAADGKPGNAAPGAAPAVLFTLVVVFFVEALLHFF